MKNKFRPTDTIALVLLGCLYLVLTTWLETCWRWYVLGAGREWCWRDCLAIPALIGELMDDRSLLSMMDVVIWMTALLANLVMAVRLSRAWILGAAGNILLAGLIAGCGWGDFRASAIASQELAARVVSSEIAGGLVFCFWGLVSVVGRRWRGAAREM